MQTLKPIVYLALTVFLFSCDQQNPTSDIDPKLGFECFESRRASLPPGTQYEGIEKLAENRLMIKIMNGAIIQINPTIILTQRSPSGTLEFAPVMKSSPPYDLNSLENSSGQ